MPDQLEPCRRGGSGATVKVIAESKDGDVHARCIEAVRRNTTRYRLIVTAFTALGPVRVLHDQAHDTRPESLNTVETSSRTVTTSDCKLPRT
jgi:hypothetical protein